MLLLTMREHYFTGREGQGWKKHDQRTIALATDLPLVQALERIKIYERAYKDRYGQHSVVEFSLLSAATLTGEANDPAAREALNEAQVTLVEQLHQSANEIRTAWGDPPN